MTIQTYTYNATILTSSGSSPAFDEEAKGNERKAEREADGWACEWQPLNVWPSGKITKKMTCTREVPDDVPPPAITDPIPKLPPKVTIPVQPPVVARPELYVVTIYNLPQIVGDPSEHFFTLQRIALTFGWGLNNMYLDGNNLILQMEKRGSLAIAALVLVAVVIVAGMYFKLQYEVKKYETDAIVETTLVNQSRAWDIINDPDADPDAKAIAKDVVEGGTGLGGGNGGTAGEIFASLQPFLWAFVAIEGFKVFRGR